MDLRTLCSNGRIVHKNKMFNLYLDQKLVDTELILSDGSIKVHGAVLASESKVASKLMKSLPGPLRTLKWTQYSKEVMRLVIEYIYRGRVTYARQLETQIKSLTKYLQLNGISIEKKHISTKHETESFETTHDLITNIKAEEVLEISDESLNENEIKSGDNIESVHTGSAQSVLADSKNVYSSRNCRIVEESIAQQVLIPPKENNAAITHKQLEANNTSDSTFLSLTSDTFLSIPPKENDFAISSKPLEANNTSTFLSLTSNTFLPIPPKENDFAISSKPLEANNTSTFLSVTSDTFLSIPPKENDFAIPIKPLEANNTSTFLSLTSDTSLPIPPKENDFAISSKPLEGNDTSTSLSLTSDTFFSIPPKENDLVISSKPLEENDTSTSLTLTSDTVLPIPPQENDFAISSKPLESNNSNTSLSLTSETCLSPQLKQSELLKTQIFGQDDYFTLTIDDTQPNLTVKKNPFAKMIKKKVSATRKLFILNEPPPSNVLEDILRDLQVDITKATTKNTTNQNVQSKISINSHNLITTSDQENVLPSASISPQTSRKRKRAMIGTKIK